VGLRPHHSTVGRTTATEEVCNGGVEKLAEKPAENLSRNWWVLLLRASSPSCSAP